MGACTEHDRRVPLPHGLSARIVQWNGPYRGHLRKTELASVVSFSRDWNRYGETQCCRPRPEPQSQLSLAPLKKAETSLTVCLSIIMRMLMA